MAIFGFVALMLLGIYLTVIGLGIFHVLASFGRGGNEFLIPVVLLALALTVFYTAVKYAPFTITFSGS